MSNVAGKMIVGPQGDVHFPPGASWKFQPSWKLRRLKCWRLCPGREDIVAIWVLLGTAEVQKSWHATNAPQMKMVSWSQMGTGFPWVFWSVKVVLPVLPVMLRTTFGASRMPTTTWSVDPVSSILGNVRTGWLRTSVRPALEFRCASVQLRVGGALVDQLLYLQWGRKRAGPKNLTCQSKDDSNLAIRESEFS